MCPAGRIQSAWVDVWSVGGHHYLGVCAYAAFDFLACGRRVRSSCAILLSGHNTRLLWICIYFCLFWWGPWWHRVSRSEEWRFAHKPHMMEHLTGFRWNKTNSVCLIFLCSIRHWSKQWDFYKYHLQSGFPNPDQSIYFPIFFYSSCHPKRFHLFSYADPAIYRNRVGESCDAVGSPVLFM